MSQEFGSYLSSGRGRSDCETEVFVLEFTCGLSLVSMINRSFSFGKWYLQHTSLVVLLVIVFKSPSGKAMGFESIIQRFDSYIVLCCL